MSDTYICETSYHLLITLIKVLIDRNKSYKLIVSTDKVIDDAVIDRLRKSGLFESITRYGGLEKIDALLDDSAFKLFVEEADTVEHSTTIQKFYDAENENGRINFFWDATTAFLVEELYIISADPNNKFIECFDDESASNITYRIILFQNALERLKEYNPELNELCEY